MNLLGILAIFIQNLLFSEAQKLLDSLLTGSFTSVSASVWFDHIEFKSYL